MSDSFLLTLDTVTHLTAAINGGNPSTENTIVTLELGLDPDAAEVKIWGDINPLDPTNAGMGETEGDASWLPADPSFLVALTTNPAQKTLHVRVRDDVWNEATAEAAIQLGEGSIPPTPTPPPVHPEPLPANGPPEPRRGEHRTVLSNGRAGRVRDHASVRVRRVPSPNPSGAAPSAAVVRTGRAVASQQLPTRVRTSVRARVVGVRQAEGSAPSSAGVRRRDGAEFIATLEALGIL